MSVTPSPVMTGSLYIYRKGQPCKVTARGRMNSIRVELPAGHIMVTSGNAVPKAKPADCCDGPVCQDNERCRYIEAKPEEPQP